MDPVESALPKPNPWRWLQRTMGLIAEDASTTVQRRKAVWFIRAPPWPWLVVGAAWSYTIAVLAWALSEHDLNTAKQIASWAQVPVAVATWLLVGVLLAGKLDAGPRRRGWWLVFAAIPTTLAGTLLWNLQTWVPSALQGPINDALFLLYYVLVSLGSVQLFLSCGGSLRRRRLWLDFGTLTIAAMAVLWPFMFGAFTHPAAGPVEDLPTKAAYAVVIILTIAIQGLLVTQVIGSRPERHLLLLVAGVISGLIADIVWFATPSGSVIGSIIDMADVVGFAFISTAAAAAGLRRPAAVVVQDPNEATDSFVPALLLLLAACVLAGSVATVRGLDGWMLSVFVILGISVLLVRHTGVRAELHTLYRALAKREADARLIELARCSSDCVIVVNSARMLSFVGPTAQFILGVRAEVRQNSPVQQLLGPPHEAQLGSFIDALIAEPRVVAHLEVGLTAANGGQRVLEVTGRNQLDNPLIRGLTLTITDATEQRALQREVLDISTHERLRLSSDVHEGLGQELTGIALLLRSVRNRSLSDERVLQKSLDEIGSHVSRAICTARDLATGLSPLQVVGGSLAAALMRLAEDVSSRLSVHVDAEDLAVDDKGLDIGIADHLYRIAHEAVGNALNHSGCTLISIALYRDEAGLSLVVTDNGRGFPGESTRHAGLGLRMMEYRARIIGGKLRREPAPGGGTRMSVTVPGT